MLDTAGAGVTPRKNFPAAYTPSFRWPVLPSGDAPCLLGWEGLSAQHFAFLPPLQGFSASALLTPGGGRFLAGGACPVHCWIQDLTLLSRGDRDLGFAFQTHPGSQFSP